MRDVKEVYEMVTQQTPPKPDALERQRKRQVRHMMNRRLGAFAMVAVIAGLAVLALRSTGGDGRRQPADSPGTEPSVSRPGVRGVDFMLDLETGAKTPLPDAIVRWADQRGTGGRYAFWPDGALLAYVGPGAEGTPQIFISGLDGSGVRQVTHDPEGAASPAWSPDGKMIAYVEYGEGDVGNLFVLDVATGESTLIIDGVVWGPQFTPDGSSILYASGTDQEPVLLTVPVAGGPSTLLIGPGEGITDAWNGSLSPDGSLVTFVGSGFPRSGTPEHCGPCRFVANADGTERRVIPGWTSNPAGTWSPDGPG